MSALWEAQQGLAQALTDAGLSTLDVTPEKAAPPLRYVMFESADQGQSFGSLSATLNVICVTRPGTNAVMANTVLDMATEVVNAVDGLDGYALASPAVGAPARYPLNGNTTLAVAVSVTARITRAQLKR